MINFSSKNRMLPEKSFKLCTTSFIYPDNIIPNVNKLGLFFDEIELLVFESRPKEVLPSRDDINELAYLSQKYSLTYNIHLPVDVSLTCDSCYKRLKASDTVFQVIERFLPLNPSTYTLHLDMPLDINIEKSVSSNHTRIKEWQKRVRQSLENLIPRMTNPDIISIETLDYPFDFVESFIEEFNLSVCIDAGHQIKYGYDLLATYSKHRLRTPIIHLHGVDFAAQQTDDQTIPAYKIKDHTHLDKLPEQYISQLKTILNDYTGVVSLEVFNLEDLTKSLFCLQQMLANK